MKYKTLFRKLAKSKKGFDDDLTDIIIGIIFIALIFIVVFVYITNTEVRIEQAIEEENNNLEKDFVLLNYLRTPMERSDITIAEYLGSLSKKELEESDEYVNGKNGFCCTKGKGGGGRAECTEDGQLTKEIKEILEGTTNWQVKMLIAGGEEFCSITKDITKQKGGNVLGETVKAIIPSSDPDFNIEIYFKFQSG